MINPVIYTNAYRIIKADKESGSLSHAYLVSCADESMLESYLIELSKLIVCDDYETASSTRDGMLIEKKAHPDVSFYPKEKKLSVVSADEIIAQSVIKPLELSLRLFVLVKFEELAQYQNKLLKTLEEPPKNVILLMGTVNENAVLPTVRSRSKALTVPLFSDERLFSVLRPDCPDEKKLSLSVSLSGGRLGEALRYYRADYTEDLFDLAVGIMLKMTKAGDVLSYAARMKNFAVNEVIAALKVVCGKALSGDEQYKNILNAYRPAVLIAIADRLNKFEKTVNFNANATMVTDGVLFAVMEEKSKWQRLSV
ncbi:MAG: hypothetical protein ILP02_00955 [Clostridia bacterium]|nr:hypothetical protein [Clostridia bacterium]